MSRVLTAMSGGVDSAVTAALLLEAGHTVGGATMALHEYAPQELADARRSAERLGIEFHIFDWQEEFFRLVQRPFMEIYQAGWTPNPCVICNRTVKFGLFLDKALALGYEKMATGHYARVEWDAGSGRWLLRRAADAAKDQSYVLYSLTQAQLSRVLLPMGGMTKDAAREKAEALGLAVAHKHDSQDICFVPDGDYMRFLTEHGVRPQPGHFIGLDGRDFGPHRGQEAYTLGQRRGLDIPYGTRIYVVAKRGSDVVIGPNEALFSRRVLAGAGAAVVLRLDTRAKEQHAMLERAISARETWLSDTRVRLTENGAELCFDEPQRAVTPGQAAVLYDGDTVLGGGTICGAD